jgi:hypothetical protein
MADRTRIMPGMQVITSDGELLGTVDRPEDGGFMLRRMSDVAAGPQTVPDLWIHNVDHSVHLNRTGAEAIAGWKSMQFQATSQRTESRPARTAAPANRSLLIWAGLLLLVVLAIALYFVLAR